MTTQQDEIMDSVDEFNLTDLGNAERIIKKYGNSIIFNHTTNRWHIYEQGVWRADDKKETVEYAKSVVKEMFDAANAIKDDSRRSELIKHALRCENPYKLEAMLKLAESEEILRVTEPELDKNPYYLNLQNGTYNLKTGILQPHNPSDLLSKKADIQYDIQATAPFFMKFLQRIFDGDAELILYMQRALGCSLVGESQTQHLFFCFGSGANGKSALFETLTMVLGKYILRAPMEMLLKKPAGGIPNDIALLKGARIVVASETTDGRSWDEARVKELTGGDTITARQLYGKYFEFQPSHTLWIHGNHKPIVHGTDDGIWRRMIIIPFNTVIPAAERVPMAELIHMMSQEKSGILNWLLDGYKDYQTNGLKLPESINREIEKYRNDSNSAKRFIIECCESDPAGSTPLMALYDHYHMRCNESGDYPVGKKELTKAFEIAGYKKEHGTGNITIIRGIRLR